MLQKTIRKEVNKLPGKVISKIEIPTPKLISGYSSRKRVSRICKNNNYKRVLLLCDKFLYEKGYHEVIIKSLNRKNIDTFIFYEFDSEPNVNTIKKAVQYGLDNRIDCIISLGGGSVLDSGKIISCAIKLKTTSIKKLLLKFLYIKNKSIPIIAIPSTAGTGAETTIGAVITCGSIKKSTVIIGLNIVGVILDSELIIDMPNQIKVPCAIDALSHGLEGYISSAKSSKEDLKKSATCIKLIIKNLPKSISRKNKRTHDKLQLAAYYGGNAINKQLAGYIHAFAHSLGGMYHIPHGQAISMCLVPILNYHKEVCSDKLYELSKFCGYKRKDKNESINKFIAEVTKICNLCDTTLCRKKISKKDYKELTRRIILDSINYSSPVVLEKKEIYYLLDQIKGGNYDIH